ncbi:MULTISPECIES: DUF397 domain-containing protein [unclassified Streptomyces]|uniref:DUF397 domain-containing protein n=1 Tax=unclassified Streptomyces TaxID=2593676 RepID=UPI0003658E89|nr:MULTISPECIES: DUF397 domain-containing protein [unclassified Streptomyces]MYY06069.1 DUF397 domain-containing protein [Streptomyces sp. SID4913]
MKRSGSDYDLSTATWHKSSYSGGDGGDCVEIATWRKSTYSDGSGGNCLEVLDGVPVRDSKVPNNPAIIFHATAWHPFITDLKHG